MNIFARMWSPVIYPFKDQLLESQLLQDSFNQLAQIGRWWQNLSASGRTLRRGPRRLCTFPHLHVFSPERAWEVKLTVSAYVLLTGDGRSRSDDSQQSVADDVPGPSAMVVHVSNILLYEPSEDTAAASSCPPAGLWGDTCPGVWALSVQRQVRVSEQSGELQTHN